MSKEDLKKPGVFSWNELISTDIDTAKAFYSELLGWTLNDVDTGKMLYTLARNSEREVAGMMALPKDAPKGMQPGWIAYVTVTDVDASLKRAQALGANVCMPPIDVPDIGRFTVLSDPQGVMFGMFSCK